MIKEYLQNLNIILEEKSKYQTIRLYELEDGRIMLTLDTFAQFVEGEDSDIYHKSLLRPIIDNYSYKLFNKFLILGGGDGILADYIYKYYSSVDITLVELDPKMIELFSTNPRLLKINNNSLSKCNIIIEDAKEYIKKCNIRYNAIFCDFPDANNEELKELYTREFYSNVIKLLKKNGIISIQTNPEITDKVVVAIHPFVREINIIEYNMPYLGRGKVVVGKGTYE